MLIKGIMLPRYVFYVPTSFIMTPSSCIWDFSSARVALIPAQFSSVILCPRVFWWWQRVNSSHSFSVFYTYIFKIFVFCPQIKYRNKIIIKYIYSIKLFGTRFAEVVISTDLILSPTEKISFVWKDQTEKAIFNSLPVSYKRYLFICFYRLTKYWLVNSFFLFINMLSTYSWWNQGYPVNIMNIKYVLELLKQLLLSMIKISSLDDIILNNNWNGFHNTILKINYEMIDSCK